ncbi:MAG: hypothetical protein H8E44_09950 [Planctomycetes bacterium]|nr:hypothetical protein [Planctomycetota bacterium]MBL7041971.1 hypothetical protein [Pirellulaceae bacterium]
MTHSNDDSTTPSDPADRMSESGWIIEPTESGGVRMRLGAAVRGCTLGCSFCLLLLFGLFAAFMYFVGGRLWEDPPEDRIALVFLTLISLLILGTIGLAVVAIVLQVLWLMLAREEWEVGTNRLEIRRRLLGFSWGSHHRDGVLLLEANYRKDEARPFWQLAVKSDGQKRYLIREGAISVHGTAIGFKPSREVVETIAELLAQHTGWSVTWAESEAAEAVRSTAERRELPAELRAAGFLAGVDERLRLRIRPPTRGQLIFGIVLVVLGGGWTVLLAGATKSFVLESDFAQQPLVNLPFLFLMAAMLMAGVVAALLGVVIIFGRERWILDRNLFIVRSRLFGWKSEQQYVDGTFNLARVITKNDDERVWRWELQLQDQAGGVLKDLRSYPDDDVPRLLGAVLSECTGWPLREAEDLTT